MNEIISDVIVGLITAGAAIWAAKITARGETKKGVAEVEAKIEAWKLLYEHDADGKEISGSLDNLRNAVEAAYQIRVKIVQANWIKIMESQWSFSATGIVHALNTEQISLGPDDDGNYKIFDDAYHYYVLVNTRGNYHAKRVFIDGRQHKESNTKRRMAWYAMIP